ncbi:MAG: hypothetical protein ACJ75B_03240 [Flavisolibacter sp.]
MDYFKVLDCFRLGRFPFLFLLILPLFAPAQKSVVTDSSQSHYRTLIAGKEYEASSMHRWLWGKDYRKEWTTPVTVPILNLDSAFGGLRPVKIGGGRQTKTLRLSDPQGREYVLRTVHKTYDAALPDIVHGTFIVDLVNDQVAGNHPYAALTVPMMSEASGVYHTNPHYYFVPYSPRLEEYNEEFANTLCMLEERPDETQTTQQSFGQPEDIQSTEDMLEKINGDNDHLMDQHDYIKTRLFDMLIGDWGRHPDNWRWARFDSGSFKLYRPVPKDRDQTYAKFEGFLLSFILGAVHLKQLQTFDGKIKNIEWYNYPALGLDRRFSNELTRQAWTDSAKALQQYLKDPLIENSVRQMPAEMYAISGDEITRKLKSRRDKMVKYADKYYSFLAKNVDVAGTKEKEVFDVRGLNQNETEVKVFAVKKNGTVIENPVYARRFHKRETKEIRLYGMGGDDVYRISGVQNDIKIRVIGGTATDSVINERGTAKKLTYYDYSKDYTSGTIKTVLSSDSSLFTYPIRGLKYDESGVLKSATYSNTRGVFVELGYRIRKQKFNKNPYGMQQVLKGNFSLFNNSFGADYIGEFNQIFGKWNLLLNGRVDQRLKNYYFGLGNETSKEQTIEYYRMYTGEAFASAGLHRPMRNNQVFSFTISYQSIKVENEAEKHFINQGTPPNDPTVFNRKDFIGGTIGYSILKLDNAITPRKGIGFAAEATHLQNLTQTDRKSNHYEATFGFYLPLIPKFSLGVRSGVINVTGNPEFYQLAWLGGGQNLRGFHRQRFFGQTAFYDDNEIRWITNIRGHLFNGKIGLIGFLDDGRVWNKDEVSMKWHLGYGGGLMLVPFNRIAVIAYYGMSQDDKLIHLRLGRFF